VQAVKLNCGFCWLSLIVSLKAMSEFNDLKGQHAQEVDRRMAVEDEVVSLQQRLVQASQSDVQKQRFAEGCFLHLARLVFFLFLCDFPELNCQSFFLFFI